MRTFDTIHDVNVPANKLDLIATAGRTGNVIKATGDARTVSTADARIQPIDAIVVANGPLSARSSKAARLGGNDRIGVTHPKVPISTDGIGVGIPILIRRHLATK
jgi:hypothetical protein